ncbi:MAG: M15 family metallopeptidase [Patescibacteria group bacterium]
MYKIDFSKINLILIGLIGLFLLQIGIGGYNWYSLDILKTQFDNLNEEQTKTSKSLNEAENEIEMLTQDISNLRNSLNQESSRLDMLSDQVEGVTGSVGDLEKLSQTDPELLKKYSRVYFLNEHYAPADLIEIDDRYVAVENKNVLIQEKVWPYLSDMIRAAARDDIDLRLISGYRSFQEQFKLKENYKIRYGVGTANEFSADQGYSEHQLGTAVDLTTEELGLNFTDFAKTEAYDWLLDNAHRFGFVLSYSEDNDYYLFEPWHWRFVGVRLAKDLHREGDNFYDWNQRDIDEYLIHLYE